MPQVRHSVCALDCPDACSLLVDVEKGQGSRLRGDPAHPITRGFLCGKVAQYLDREYSPRRLLYPQKRIGAKGEGRFTRISWDDALNETASRLLQASREFGPESILPYSYAGNMGYLNSSGMDRRFFHRLGASRLDRTICSSAGGAGLTEALGIRYGTEPEQFRHSRLILAWGANILSTNVHLWPFIVEARRNGARFYVIDPHLSRTARLADHHFAPFPGSDAALALGLMHVILGESLEDAAYIADHTTGIGDLRALAAQYPPERTEALTGIPAAQVVQLAREYATTRPAVIRVNYGVQRSERGGLAVRLISRLPALTGSWKHVGGGLQLSTSGAFHVNLTDLQLPGLQQLSPLGREARLVNMVELGQALNTLSDPPVKAMVVYNSNPAAVAPNQNSVLRGLSRPDLFTVVLEQFQTDTANYADILLPVTTFLEETDLYLAYGHYYLQLARPALPPPGETLPNVEIFRRLARHCGLSDPCLQDSDDALIRAALNTPHPFFAGITLEDLEREHFIRLRVSPEGAPFLPFANGFATPDGKCDLGCTGMGGRGVHAPNLDYTPPVESRHGDAGLLSRFPLELISPKSHNAMNSTFGYNPALDAETACLAIHPEDALPRGIQTGDSVRVFNDRGECFLHAKVAPRSAPEVRRGVVATPSVRWLGTSANGRTVNALVSERLTDIGGGPTFYSCLVEIEKHEN
ncbi:MAG: molybdopterin-dependent oxidoreductase [Acidobacteriota bacterium]|nr:molybdopterin-dependent oxidoreductase [Acidobacteriota bacterium]